MRVSTATAIVGVILGLCPARAAPLSAGSVASPVPAFGGCSAARPVVRPTYILVGCGDGGVSYKVARWSSWTSPRAWGSGKEFVNLCKPACAAGHFRTYRVALRLWRPRLCSNRRLEFTRLSTRRIASGHLRILRSPWGSVDRVTCP